MTMTKDQVKSAALQLDPSEREALAEELLLSIDGTERSAIDAAWLDEARRRDEAFRSGRTSAKSVDDVIARLTNKDRRSRQPFSPRPKPTLRPRSTTIGRG